MENMGDGWKACSGCAGDYEDPERSAWEAEEEDSDEGELPPKELVEEE